MKALRKLSICFVISPAVFLSGGAGAQANPAAATPAAIERHDGQRDFDFEIGTWKIHLKRLTHPLTGSTTWVELDGASVTRGVWNSHANLEEFEVDGSTGHIEGLTLRLYDPKAHQWSLYWASGRTGTMGGPPTVGEFKDGRGEFYSTDTINDRTILVRYIWSAITPTSAHFEQSFSDDGGKTWEVNWITDQTRVTDKNGR